MEISALTAYGLMQFTDMSRVLNIVGKEMIERTKKWLLERIDKVKGGFQR